MNRSVIALGGNLPYEGAPPWRTFQRALGMLTCNTDHRLRGVARLWRSDPVHAEGPAFFNSAAWIDTPLGALDFLTLLLRTEIALGRSREPRESAAPTRHADSKDTLSAARTVDLDLIWFEGAHSATVQLMLPHPRASQRGFVLGPLRDLSPTLLADLRLPCPISGAPFPVEHHWRTLPASAHQGLSPVDAAHDWAESLLGEVGIV